MTVACRPLVALYRTLQVILFCSIVLLPCFTKDLHVQAALSLEQPPLPATTTTTTTPVAQVHRQYADLPEGKHVSQRVSIHVVVQEVKPTSPRLVFLRGRDADSLADSEDDDDSSDNSIELLLPERDSFLSCRDIEQITQAASQPGATLHCVGYPEKLSFFDGPSFFPHLLPTIPSGVCLHVVAANVTLATGELVPVCPTENPSPPTSTKTVPPGRMPPIRPGRTNKSRGGGGNRDRGGIFAAWALDTFGPTRMQGGGILDVAGGAGQLAFQLGVRRGYSITVVDPRPLRLASDQQRTLQYHREKGLRLLPDGRDPSAPTSDYGHHFCEVLSETKRRVVDNAATTHTHINSNAQTGDRTWLVGGEAHVRHLATWFDPAFASTAAWRDSSVVLGMHPDEPTEDIVDLCLAHDKPFAVVPCCVFWKRDPHRKTPTGKPVRTWEQFCEYLAAKDDQRIKMATLPFPGRNTVLYSLGDCSK